MPEYISQEAIRFANLVLRDLSPDSWIFVLAKNQDLETAHHFRIRRRDLDSRLPQIQMYKQSNYYISASGFSGGKKRTEQFLYSLDNIVIDIDCHKNIKTPGLLDLQLDHFVDLILRDGVDQYGLLEPSAIVYTGRGLQLWWFHESLSAQSNRWTWDKVGENLIAILQKILLDHKGRDPFTSFYNLSIDLSASRSPAGVYRLPGTKNQAAGCKATVKIISERRYSLSELKEFNAANRKKVNHYVLRLKSDTQKWAGKMLSWVETLRFSRHSEAGDELRNNFCFVYFCLLRSAGFSDVEAEAKIELFNSNFVVPLRPQELSSCLCTARRKSYKLSTKAISEILCVTEAEKDYLLTAYSAKQLEKKAAREAKAKRDKKVITLWKRGRYTLKEIAEKSGVSIPTARRILRKNDCVLKESRNEKIIVMIESGMTAVETAAKVGCSESTVWRVLREHRKRAPKIGSEPISFFPAPCQKKTEKRNNGYPYTGPSEFRAPSGTGKHPHTQIKAGTEVSSCAGGSVHAVQNAVSTGVAEPPQKKFWAPRIIRVEKADLSVFWAALEKQKAEKVAVGEETGNGY